MSSISQLADGRHLLKSASKDSEPETLAQQSLFKSEVEIVSL
jgi:hypothetical protein